MIWLLEAASGQRCTSYLIQSHGLSSDSWHFFCQTDSEVSHQGCSFVLYFHLKGTSYLVLEGLMDWGRLEWFKLLHRVLHGMQRISPRPPQKKWSLLQNRETHDKSNPTTLGWTRFDTWHKSATMCKTLWCLSHWETHDNPTTSKLAYGDVKEAFLAEGWNSFHLTGENKITCTSRIFSNMHVNCTWSNHWLQR